MAMIYCPDVFGVEALACISSQTNYILGYLFLIMFVGALYFNLSREPTRERLASIGLVTAIVTALGAVKEMLFPTEFFIVAVVLAIGAVVMLIVRR